MKSKKVLILVSIIAFGTFVGWFVAFIKPVASGVQVERHSFASYLFLSREERIDAASAIFTGKVTSISQTQWNQDSGQEWARDPDAPNPPNTPAILLIHTFTIEVDQMIVDTIDLGKEVTVTVIGHSPYDGQTEHGLQVGDFACFFVEERNLAW